MTFSCLGCRFGPIIIYQRYILAFMTICAMIHLYAMRHVMSHCMPYLSVMQPSEHFSENVTFLGDFDEEEEICESASQINSTPKALLGNVIHWTIIQEKYITSSFYVGYVATHIPFGALCDLYGGRHFLSLGILCCSLITYLTPAILRNMPWWIMILVRILLGALQGICMPAIMSLISHWVPMYQLTSLCTIAYSGGCLGNVISALMSSYFLDKLGNWPALFYFWGSMSMIWYFAFIYMVFSRPTTHPFISLKEKTLLEDELGTTLPRRVPWKGILTDNAIWALFAGQIGHNWILFIMAHNLPLYFKTVVGFDLTDHVISLALPYVFFWLSTITVGFIGDHLIKKHYIPVIYLRTVFTAMGNILPSILVLIATYVGCNQLVVMVLFTLAMLSKGPIFAGLKTNILDVSRHFAGVVQGIENGLGALSGAVSPIIIRYMCPDNSLQQWRKVFWLSFAICIFTTTLYFIWSKGERADWDYIESESDYRLR